MGEIIQAILNNLQNVGMGLLLFLLSYISNMAFAMYYNMKVVGENFDKEKMKNSLLKLISFVIGCATLVIVVTTLPLFATYTGFELPSEFIDTFSTIAIIAVPLYASCKYALSAFSKMKDVLNSSTNSLASIQQSFGDTEGYEGATTDGFIEENINTNVGNEDSEINVAMIEPDVVDYEKMEEVQNEVWKTEENA